jgi:D-alanyl-D-alanine carboxypeptidase
VLIAGAVILVAAVAWVGVQLLRPVPPMALTASVTTVRVLPGVTPRPDWPGRAEAAVGLTGVGLLGAHGGSRPVPIASLVEIMTAYVVLRGHPLPAGGPGPPIAVTAADAAAYASDKRHGQSVVKVERGEKLIMAMPRVMLPVAGPAYNVNSALGHEGIVGVKTGSSSQAGGCLAFAAIRTVAGSLVTIVGVVLGVRATAARPSALGGVIAASENLLGSIGRDLEHAQVIRPGAVLGNVSSAWGAGPAAVAAAGVSVTAWPGTPVTVTVRPRPLTHTISQGQPVAQAPALIGGDVRRITLLASRAAPAPSVRWLLTRL